ncbi:hypothetical protein FSW04_22645 [Baekduia soli]|uniref:Uncharacterized protein n=1 Tax=Baekduia soli TaxID=496014 RepID=A0A5B8UAN9_9ACTN|nr:hypothetical protein [Baekduia soli]QEC50095.1 hypothetical protein FSW04_22645 [Baekduia soli]
MTALAVAAAGYGAFLAAAALGHGTLTVDTLLHQNLFPRGPLRESVAEVYRVLAPRTPRSFAGLAGQLALYGTGAAAVVAAGVLLARRRAGRRAAVALVVAGALVAVLAVLAAPETSRFYLKYAFAWMPAGALLASLGLGAAALRGRARPWAPADQLALMVALLVVGFSFTVYARFAPYPNPKAQQGTAYAMPLIAVLLAWLHVRVLPRVRPAAAGPVRALGLAWLALLAAACLALLVHDARRETVMVHGPHGVMAATAADGPVYQQAVDVIQRTTRPSEPILLAPQMTSLYVMTDRVDPLPQLSLLPGALDGPADERQAIRTLQDRGVRLAVIDRTQLALYHHGAFGVGYDRIVGAWLHTHFAHITTIRGTAAADGQPRTLDVWLRRPHE